ncbi:MAG: hypothetical protein OEY31_09745, partial [Candidatus Bathyarchaeota archaeon]|nr:hypothetical protein [Candidatus Bathyarchaeota archaeon]
LVRELLIRFDREMALILSFFIFSVSYAALLTLFYLGELYVTFILISVTISFGHFIAAISNLSIYLNKLWLWYSLRVLVANSEYIFLTVSVSAMLVEYCYKRKAKCKAVT